MGVFLVFGHHKKGLFQNLKTHTLYLTDLDGTLLNSEKQVSASTVSLMNALVDRGAKITIASARSPVGLQMIDFHGMRFSAPLVLMNGVLLYDYASRQIVDSVSWQCDTARAVLDCCAAFGKYPFVYRVNGHAMDIQYTNLTSPLERQFLKDRDGIAPGNFRHVETIDVEGAAYCSMQDTYELLHPLYEKLLAMEDVDGVLYSDTYHENNWYLEVFSRRAGKGEGVKRSAKAVGATRIVVFGDNYNDLSMFQVADVACAVANAEPGVKTKADVLIGSNDDDGVARFITQDFE